MRVIWTAAAALIALCVSGCDINTTPKTAKVECNCTTSPAPPAGMRGSDEDVPPPPYRHRHGHGGYARYHDRGHSWRREYSEISVFTYDYHSDSYGGTMGGASGGASVYAGTSGGGAVSGAAAQDTPPADDRARLKPWRGYDVDCPDKPAH
jgi:hypothetical protein